MVFVMDGEFAEGLARKLATASCTDVREDSERLLTVTLLSRLLVAPGIGEDLRPLLQVWLLSFGFHQYRD